MRMLMSAAGHRGGGRPPVDIELAISACSCVRMLTNIQMRSQFSPIWLRSPSLSTRIHRSSSPLRVGALARCRLKFEGRDKDAEVQPGGRYHGKPVAYAMDRFAYHVCYKCKKPYFGGARQCGEAAAGAQHAAAAGAGAGAAHAPAAGGGGGVLGDNDLIDDGEEEERDPNKDLICSGCSKPPPGVTACPRHGTEGLEYKCRYCCSPAVWFCFGSTHFCEPCHSGWSGKPGGLKPQVCPGRATCPLGCDHPKNSAKEDGEFALGCYKCRADNTGF